MLSVLESKCHLDALDQLAHADRLLSAVEDIGVTAPCRIADLSLPVMQELVGDPLGLTLSAMNTADAHAGMTDRCRWTLEWSGEGAEKAPRGLFAKATPPSAAHREMLAVLHMDQAEVRFYNEVAPELGDLVPRCFHASSFGGGRSLVLLEDIEQTGCVPYWQGYDCTPEHARAVAVALARIHAQFWQSERLGTDLSWIRPRPRRYGVNWLLSAHDGVRTTFLGNPPREHVSATALAALEVWHECSRAVIDYWQTLPATVLHGDSHLGNTFSRPDGSAGYFDWQVTFSGPGLRDLSYFLMSALTNEQRQEHERSIFETYVDVLKDHGVAVDQQQLWDEYVLFAFDRFDATIMAWVHGTYNHAPEGQLRMFRTISGAIEDNGVPDRLKRLRSRL